VAKNKSSDKSTMSPADKSAKEDLTDDAVAPSQDEAATSSDGRDADSDASPETDRDAPPAELDEQPEGRMPEPDAAEEPRPESALTPADPDQATEASLDEDATSATGQEGGTDTDPTEPADTALASEEAEPEASAGDMREPGPADTAVHTAADTPPPPPAAEKVVVEKRGGFFPLVLGGVIAAAIGFAAGSTGLLNSVLPSSVQDERDSAAAQTSSELAALKSETEQQAKDLEALKAQLAESPAPADSPDVDALKSTTDTLSTKLAALEKSVADLTSQTGPLADRVTRIEQNPSGDAATQAATESFKAELAKLSEAIQTQKATLDKQIAEQETQMKSFAADQDQKIQALVAEAKAAEAKAQELEAAASAAAQRSEMRAVVADIGIALNDGSPYADLVAKLTAGDVDVPDALATPADGGVPTLSSLRDSFPQTARDALAAVRQGESGGLQAFLDRQLQVRTIEPKEGNSADAILSRAQAAISAGELEKAVTLVGSLSEPAKSAVQSWETAAQTRLAAVQANASLAQSLNSN
tara:strand:- start:5346 stop:6935 length:1590 start_codon:yes stop_codon:yes gene_type:complete